MMKQLEREKNNFKQDTRHLQIMEDCKMLLRQGCAQDQVRFAIKLLTVILSFSQFINLCLKLWYIGLSQQPCFLLHVDKHCQKLERDLVT